MPTVIARSRWRNTTSRSARASARSAGKVFRIGHLGECNDLMLLGALSGVEMGLAAAGVPHRSGGVAAAMKIFEAADAGNAPAAAVA